LNTIELSKQDDDFILRNKIGLYIEERKKVEARELIKKIKDPNLKSFSIKQVESC